MKLYKMTKLIKSYEEFKNLNEDEKDEYEDKIDYVFAVCESFQNYNEVFEDLDDIFKNYIDVNFNGGSFAYHAVRHDNAEMLKMLIHFGIDLSINEYFILAEATNSVKPKSAMFLCNALGFELEQFKGRAVSCSYEKVKEYFDSEKQKENEQV